MKFQDINSGTNSSDIQFLGTIDSIVFFKANNEINGVELWMLNTNSLTAHLIKDCSKLSSSSDISQIYKFHDKLYFDATDELSDQKEPWVSDGTTSGTHMLKDILTGNMGSNPINFIELNDHLYFFTQYPEQNLFESDGTSLGTNAVLPISFAPWIKPVVFNNYIYFGGIDSDHGLELWRTDGTIAGTGLFLDVNNGPGDSNLSAFEVINDKLFFSANNGTGNYPWSTDGTIAGSHAIYTPEPGESVTGYYHYANQAVIGVQETSAFSFYISDGDITSTTPVFTLSECAGIESPLIHNDFLYFVSYIQNFRDLHRLNLTDGEDMVIDRINLGGTLTFLLHDTIYCVQQATPYYGSELYGTTDSSTELFLVKDIYPGGTSSGVRDFSVFNDQLVFIAANNLVGEEPFIKNGIQVKPIGDINHFNYSSNPQLFSPLGNKLILYADNDETGLELWVYDQTLDTIPQESEQITTCESYSWNGHLYESSGYYQDTLQDVNGQDSIISNLELIVNHATSFSVNGTPYVQPTSTTSNWCDGFLEIKVPYSLDFYCLIDNSEPVTNQGIGRLDIGNLCHGIHQINTTDSCGSNYQTYFVIPYPNETIYNVNNTDILDSVGYINENCFIGYESIDTAFIESITFEDSVATVIWAIIDGQNTYLDTAVYTVNFGEGNYIFQLSLYCTQKSTNSVFAITQSATLNEFTSLNDNTDVKMHLYPNPTNDLVTISFDGNNANYTIYDAQGKLIQTSKINSGGSISLKDLQTGVYFFELITEYGSTVKRVVKN